MALCCLSLTQAYYKLGWHIWNLHHVPPATQNWNDLATAEAPTLFLTTAPSTLPWAAVEGRSANKKQAMQVVAREERAGDSYLCHSIQQSAQNIPPFQFGSLHRLKLHNNRVNLGDDAANWVLHAIDPSHESEGDKQELQWLRHFQVTQSGWNSILIQAHIWLAANEP